MNRDIRLKRYRVLMFKYGITSVLMVLERLEKLEQYEECQIIIEAIKEQEQRLDCTLWTRNTKESIEEVIKTYEGFGLTGKNLIENSRYYADLIIEELCF